MNEWISQYRELDGRYETMSRALELLSRKSSHRIVETGTMRMKNDWGAGMSTYIFGSFCETFNGHIYTVDISQNNMDVCKEETERFSEYIDYIVADSLAFLNMFNKKIDLLYLDSVDCPIEIKDEKDEADLRFAQNHQLQEITLGLPKMTDDGIVLLDDVGFSHGGKGKLSREYLTDMGWKELICQQQSLWIK